MRIIIIYIFLTLLFTDFSYISNVSKAAKELVTQQIKDVYNFGHTLHRTVDEELGIHPEEHGEIKPPDITVNIVPSESSFPKMEDKKGDVWDQIEEETFFE